MNAHSPVKRGRVAKAKSEMRFRAGLMQPEEARHVALAMDQGDVHTNAFRRKVERFTEIMREDRWDANGETVVVGRSGKVLDGRARLLACIAAGRPFPVILVTGVDDAAYVSIDTHSRRSATDVLAIAEVAHPRVVSSACQAIASYINHADRTRWRYQGSTAVGTDEISLLTDAFRDDIDISAEIVMGLKTGKILSNTVAVACHFLASKADPDMANNFFREFGAAGKKGRSAPAVLRRRLETEGVNTTFTYRMAVFSKAWAAYLDKRNPTIEEIDYKGHVERLGGLGDEAFPPIRGIDPDLRINFQVLRDASPAGKARTGARGLDAYDGVTVREVDMTTELCEEFLVQNGPRGRNRSIRPGHVRDLSRMMAAGSWHANGKTIKRTRDGDLIDGQHRCRACLDAKTGFRTLVVEGLDPTCFATLDLGERKTLGKRLGAMGHTSSKQVNSICTTFWRLSQGNTGGEPTAVEAERIYAYDKERIDRSIAFVKSGKMRETLDISIAGALHRTFALYDEPLADAFMRTIATGLFALDDARNPIHKLREELKRPNGVLNTHVRKVRAVIRAWNAYVTGKSSRDYKLVEENEVGYPEILPPNEKAPRPAAAKAAVADTLPSAKAVASPKRRRAAATAGA
jgi:hypothetical protein